MPVTPEQQQAAERIQQAVDVGLEPDPGDVAIVKEAAEQARGTPDWSGEVITPSGKTGEEVIQQVEAERSERIEQSVEEGKKQIEEAKKEMAAKSEETAARIILTGQEKAPVIQTKDDKEYNRWVNALNDKSADLRRERDTLNYDLINTWNRQAEDLSKRYDAIEKRVNNLNSKREQLEKKSKNLDPYDIASYSAMADEIAKYNAEVEAINKEVNGYNQEYEKLDNERAEVDKAIKGIDSFNDKVKNLATLSKRLVKPDGSTEDFEGVLPVFGGSEGTAPDKSFSAYSKEIKRAKEHAIDTVDSIVPGFGTGVRWNTLSTEDKAIGIAGDVAQVMLMFYGGKLIGAANKTAAGVSKAERAAKAAGKAGRELDEAQKALSKTALATQKEFGISKVAPEARAAGEMAGTDWPTHRIGLRNLSDKLETARMNSYRADKAFIEQLEKVEAITPKQLSVLEKKSGLKGLKNALTEVNKAGKSLKTNWEVVNEPGTVYNPNAKTAAEIAKNERYLKQLNELQTAQNRLDKALYEANSILQPRYKPSAPAERFKGFRMTWEKKKPKIGDEDDLFKSIDGYLARDKELKPDVYKGGGGTATKEAKPKAGPKETTEEKLKLKAIYESEAKPKPAKAKTPEVEKAKPKFGLSPKEKIVEKIKTKEDLTAKEKQMLDAYAKQINKVPSELTAAELKDFPGAGEEKAPAPSDYPAPDEERYLTPQPSPTPSPQPSPKPTPESPPTTAPPAEGTPTKPLKGAAKLPFGFDVKGGKKDDEKWTPSQIKSAIAWKQGRTVFAVKSPYRQQDMRSFSVKKAPAGLVIHERGRGKGSAQKSAIVTGQFPNRLTVDVGFEDLVITKQGNRPLLTFRPDPGARTVSMLTTKRIGHGRRKRRRSRIVY